jgi:hypothetical protein
MSDAELFLRHEMGSIRRQRDVAEIYAYLLRHHWAETDWGRINNLIYLRWPGKTSLIRVKRMALAKVGPLRFEKPALLARGVAATRPEGER